MLFCQIGRVANVDNQHFELRKSLWKYTELLEDQRRMVHRRRQAALRGEAEPTLLATRAAARRTAIVARFGEPLAGAVERRLTLHHIDKAWADHLALMAHVRAGIHLAAASGLNPWLEFLEQATLAFRAMGGAVEDAIVETLETAVITEAGVDMERSGLRTPVSTWTYVINDTAFGTPGGNIIRSVQGAVRRALGRGRT